MYAAQDRREREREAAVDLSFSQILEVRSSSYKRRPHASNGSSLPRFQRQLHRHSAPSAFKTPPSSHGRSMLDSVYEDSEETSVYSPMQRRETRGLSSGSLGGSSSSFTEDEEWLTGDEQVGKDMYRFVQPRRLSSWVQDDAVNACFKCHTLFTMIIRKHHCRACGRIFCSACSSQRVVIPGDYESTPASPQYNSLTSNASDLIGNISWYFLSYSGAPTSSSGSHNGMRSSVYLDASQRVSPEAQQEKFLKDVQRLQKQGAIGKFTPCANPSGSASTPSTKSYMSSHVPDGSVMQRVCDDCACSLQQRRNHYNIVKVFELCGFNLQELRVVGQVCRKWHRASIMCLSMLRQIQYYLPTHRLSEREKALLIINRKFLTGHTKWILQLVKAIDFSNECEETSDGKQEPKGSNGRDTAVLAKDVLSIIQQPRKHKCMLTMCSRLCQPQIGSVDALEILADENIRNKKLRAMCIDALLKTATENEWLSYLPVLLQSLSIESNAAGSKLGQALIRQAHCDIRFCYDLYWGLTVTSEDASCRRKFDGMKQRLLLTLAQFKHNATYGPDEQRHDDIAEQLLRGQEFVDLMWKVPHRVPIREVRQHFQESVERSLIFEGLDKANGEPSMNPQSPRPLLRLPVDPMVKVSGFNYKTIEVKRSAEAPMILTCTGVERDEEDGDHRACAVDGKTERPAPPRSGRPRPPTLPYYRLMYKRDDLRKDAVVQNIINVMYLILKQETRLDIPLVTYRVLPTSSFDGLIEIVENAHTLYSIIRDHNNILNFLHHYNGDRTLSEISTSFRESLAAYTVITFLLGVGDRHADNVMLTKDGILFHIDYGFILGKDPKPLQPPMRLDHYMIEALGGAQTEQFEQFKKLCVIAFNCLRRHVSLFMILLNLVVKAVPEITDFDMNYTQSDLEAFVVERFLPGQTDDEAATALMLRMEGKLNEKIGLKLSDFVHAHANEKTVSKGMVSVGSSVKIGVEAVEATVSTVASSLSSGASSIYNYMWGSTMSGS
uniref:Phosphatidylinositol 3-kinase n=1 Tax=Globisporangium ultimum (strain ATCC 200006 / CBS 805.95 / DAOM BR144) TaxID=431595 RepID=K3WMB0_GLOUD